MLDITILAIGKIKEKYYSQAFEEYQKRLKPYAKISVEELRPVAFNESNKQKSKIEEGKRILDFLKKLNESLIIILDEHGKDFTSMELVKKFEAENRKIIFVIGGSLGLSEQVLKTANQKLSLSKMTLPHELARVVLIEQLYRIITISLGKEYHY